MGRREDNEGFAAAKKSAIAGPVAKKPPAKKTRIGLTVKARVRDRDGLPRFPDKIQPLLKKCSTVKKAKAEEEKGFWVRFFLLTVFCSLFDRLNIRLASGAG